MKRILIALLMFGMLLYMTACDLTTIFYQIPQESHTTTTATTTTTITTTTPTVPTTAPYESSYEPGVFTPLSYASEWLDLRLDIPSFMKATDIDAMQKLNDRNKAKDPQSYSWVEMCIQAKGSTDTPVTLIQVSTKKISYEHSGLETLAEQEIACFIEELVSAGGNGITINATHIPAERYTFFGEEYCAYAYQTKTYFQSTLYSSSCGWIMYRVKGDRLVSIMGIVDDYQHTSPHDIMAYFDTYQLSSDA